MMLLSVCLTASCKTLLSYFPAVSIHESTLAARRISHRRSRYFTLRSNISLAEGEFHCESGCLPEAAAPAITPTAFVILFHI